MRGGLEPPCGAAVWRGMAEARGSTAGAALVMASTRGSRPNPRMIKATRALGIWQGDALGVCWRKDAAPRSDRRTPPHQSEAWRVNPRAFQGATGIIEVGKAARQRDCGGGLVGREGCPRPLFCGVSGVRGGGRRGRRGGKRGSDAPGMRGAAGSGAGASRMLVESPGVVTGP